MVVKACPKQPPCIFYKQFFEKANFKGMPINLLRVALVLGYLDIS